MTEKIISDFNLKNNIHSKYKCSPIIYSKKKKIINKNYPHNNNFGSCFKKKNLIDFIDAYNSDNPSSRINFNLNDKKYVLWNNLYNKLCNTNSKIGCDESEWLSLPFIKKLSKDDIKFLKEDIFKIDNPNPNNFQEWLSNVDIDNVMQQYEKLYNDFKFVGTFPIDWINYLHIYGFEDEKTIAKLLKKGYMQLGFVFNTGQLSKGGVHWVSLFINFKEPIKINNTKTYTIEFFDSVGNSPPKEIKNLIDKIKNNVCNLFQNQCVNIIEHIPMKEHQQGNNQCGVYSLYFLTERLKGVSYEEIQRNIVKDDVMTKFRNKFFKK